MRRTDVESATLFARSTNIDGAVLFGVIAALIVLGRAIARRKVSMLEVTSTLCLLAIGLISVNGRPGRLGFWSRCVQGGAHGILTALVLASVAVGHLYTESYARESTPRAVWGSERFLSMNRRISLVWGLALLFGTASVILAGSVGDRQVLLRIIVPFGALSPVYVQGEPERARTATRRRACVIIVSRCSLRPATSRSQQTAESPDLAALHERCTTSYALGCTGGSEARIVRDAMRGRWERPPLSSRHRVESTCG